MTIALIVIAGLTACGIGGVRTANVSITGGAQTGSGPTAEELAEQERERREQAEREQQRQLIEDMRNQAIAGLNNALQTFYHDLPPGSLTEEVRQTMRDLFDQREILQTTSDPGVIWDGYHHAQALLYDAYFVAVTVGAFDPTVVGQRNWQETWFFISSP